MLSFMNTNYNPDMKGGVQIEEFANPLNVVQPISVKVGVELC
jgi:hypothetical protein